MNRAWKHWKCGVYIGKTQRLETTLFFGWFQRTARPGEPHGSGSSSKEPLGRVNRSGLVPGLSGSLKPVVRVNRFEPARDSLVRFWRFYGSDNFFRRFNSFAVRAGSEPVANGFGFGTGYKRFDTGSTPVRFQVTRSVAITTSIVRQ